MQAEDDEQYVKRTSVRYLAVVAIPFEEDLFSKLVLSQALMIIIFLKLMEQ